MLFPINWGKMKAQTPVTSAPLGMNAPGAAQKKTAARQAGGERPFVATASSSGRVVLMATARVESAEASSAASPPLKKRACAARGGSPRASLAAVGGSAPYAYEIMQKQRFAAEMRLAAERHGFTLPLRTG